MERVTRNTLKKALDGSGIDTPDTATLTQLKNLCSSVGISVPPALAETTETAEHAEAAINAELPVAEEIIGECISNNSDNECAETATALNAAQTTMPQHNETIRKLDEEVAILNKRLEIKRLQKLLAELEISTPDPNVANNQTLADMESALPTYSGDDATLSIHDFFTDFESVLALCANAERNKLLWLRRSLQGTAKLFLSTTTGLDYDELKEALKCEFGTYVRRHDVYQKLANRHWIPQKESIHAYILVMQAIAKQSQVDDMETLQFILEGLENKVGHIELLMSAQSIKQLKRFVERYQGSTLMMPKTAVQSRTYEPKPNAARLQTKNAVNQMPTKQDEESQLCFNCSRRGHIKPQCPYPLRPVSSCFRCWEMGHDHRNCPNPKKILKPRPMIHAVIKDDDEDDDCDGCDSRNLVSVAFKCDSKRSAISKQLYSLFDTGSPNSFVSEYVMPKGCHLYREKKHFIGVGGGRVSIRNAVYAEIQFKKKKYYAKLYVTPHTAMRMPLILGRDFLSQNKIKLTRSKFIYSKIQLKALDTICTSFDESTLNLLRRFDILGSKCNDCNSKFSVPDVFNIEIDRSIDELDTGPELTLSDRNKLRKLIYEEYMNSENKNSCPLPYKMKIHLSADTPFHYANRRFSPVERDSISKIIAELKENGIIRPSNSPYASAIVLVKKKNGQTRLCVDYRNLNKLTIRDNFPLPLIEDCIDYLEGKKIFSVLDLKSGFHQVEMSEESIPYTSFATPTGQYEYVRMPFGLKNAPAVFQRFVNRIFEDFINTRKIMIYLDDIVVATSDFAEHCVLLKEILKIISLRGLKLNLTKCKFACRKIEYLGYSVSENGISLTDAHLEAIKNYPMPTNYKQLHSCIGLFSYFRRFVPNFSRVAKPLLNLLKKNVKFEFDEDCIEAFQELKSKLVCAPVLSIFSPTKETQLHCDASQTGFGAILLQRQEDGKLHPVAYFSKTTSAAEAKYHSFELETLAIIYALRRFRIYVEGIPIVIVTDCNSLATTLNRKQINTRISRWALELENFDYKIVHRSGNHMPHADALSRCQIAAIIDVGEIDFQIQLAQELDDEIVAIKNKLETDASVRDFCLIGGQVCKKDAVGRNLWYVPNNMQDNVIRTVHEKLGHLAVDKTCNEILRLYWFPHIRTKVTKFIQNCLKCIMYSTPLGQRHRNMYSIPKSSLPFDTLHIDHFGPLPSLKSKRKHILVVIDSFTKYVKLYATNSTSTRETIAALAKYFAYYSRPKRVVSDRGACFTSIEFSEFMQNANVQHIQNAVSAPQANGQVERVNRTLKSMLSKLSDPLDHSDWTSKLEEIEFAMNNSVHSSTKTTPSILLFGTLQRGKIVDEFSEYLEDLLNVTAERDLTNIRQTAATNIEYSQKYNEQYFLKHSQPAKTYDTGDVVAIRNVDNTVGQNKKLIPTYKGPYVIHKILGNDRYVVRDVSNCQLSQIPYDGVIEANRLRKWSLPKPKIESVP